MQNIISEPESATKTPFISVVITAYNRREYILEAVKSVLNQTLDRSKYEVIVVKNYIDTVIDDFLRQNQVVNVYTYDISFGAMLACGIEKSRGEVISILDDDDLFLPIKLEEIFDIFQKNKNVVYARNEIYRNMGPNIEVFRNGELGGIPINSHKMDIINVNAIKHISHIYRMIRRYGVNNNSSISFRKNIYESSMEFLNDVNYLLDVFLFFWAIFNGERNDVLVFFESPLSVWRIHDSWTNVSSNSNLEAFLAKNLRLSSEGVQTYEKFKSIFKSNILLNSYFELAKNAWVTQKKMTEGNKCRVSETIAVIKVGIYRRDIYILASVPIALLSSVNPSLARKLFSVGLKRVQSYKT